MYFVSYHPLKETLRERKLTDREALPYLAIWVIVTALAAYPWSVEEGPNGWWAPVSLALDVGAAIWGVWYAYRQNGAGGGYDLIQKYVVLGWVVTVRFLLVFAPIFIALLEVGLIESEKKGPVDVVVYFLAEIILYQRIGRHIRDTVEKPAGQASEDAPLEGAEIQG
jgi:hypothetical protein